MAGVLTSDLTNHLNEIVPQVREDAVERKNTLYNFFPQEPAGGGDSYNWRVNYAGNTSAGSYGESQVEAAAGKQSHLKASLGWKAYRVMMRITRFAIEDAGGNALVVGNLVQDEVVGAFADIVEDMEDGIFSDGTGNSNLDITGIQAAVSASITYAGINRTTYTWWKAYSSTGIGSLAVSDIQTMLLNLRSSTRKGKPDYMFAGPTVFNIIGNLIDGTAYYRTDEGAGGRHLSGGFVTLDFEGVKVMSVPGYTAQRCDGIQSSDWKLVVIRDFLTDAWEKEQGTDDLISTLSWRGNLVCRAPFHQGEMTGITG